MCQDENYLTVLENDFLKVAVNCTIEFDNSNFGSTQSNNYGKPFTLLKLNKIATELQKSA